jgi:hypothetical protein
MTKGWFDISALRLFTPLLPTEGITLNEKADSVRREYEKAYGRQAPPFDPRRNRKYWFDPRWKGFGDGSAVAKYKVFEDGAFRVLEMPVADAFTVNLPGAYTYPPWQPESTRALADGQIIGPNSLATRERAMALAGELGGLEMSTLDDNRIQWNGETRRMYQLRFKGNWVNVGLLLELKHSRGFGSPGAWDLSGSSLTWVPDPVTDNGVYDPRPSVPIPCRDLEPWEEIRPAGGPVKSWVVVDTRVTSVYNPGGGGPTGDSGGHLDPDVKVTLGKILDGVTNIQRMLRGEQG